jgi:hypothetical protein
MFDFLMLQTPLLFLDQALSMMLHETLCICCGEKFHPRNQMVEMESKYAYSLQGFLLCR